MGESSIPCTEPTRDRLKALRGEGYKNWDTFLNELADAWEEKFDGTGDSDGVDSAVVTDEFHDELERLQEQVDKMPERTADELEGRMR